MAEVVAGPSGITTFGFQLGKKLHELRGLYKEFASALADIEALLTDCERLARVLDILESQWSVVAGLLPSSILFDECGNRCKTALGKLHLIACALSCSRTKSKLNGSIRGFLHQDELSQQKDQLKTVKDDIVLAMQVLNSALTHRTALHSLHQADLMPLLQSFLQQHMGTSQKTITSYQQRPSVSHIYHETHISDHAQVLQGDQHNYYYYTCKSTSHAHGSTTCEEHSETLGSVLAPTFSDAQSQIAGSIEEPQPLQQQRTGQGEYVASTLIVPSWGAASVRCEDLRGRRFVTSTTGRKQRWQLRYQSNWLHKAWHFETLRALGSWTFCFRTWNVLEWVDPLLESVRQNDVTGFQRLIASGGYTIYDRNLYGSTLLKIAISWGSLDIVYFYLLHYESGFERSIEDSFTTPDGYFNHKDLLSSTLFGLCSMPLQEICDIGGERYARCVQIVRNLFRRLPAEAFSNHSSFYRETTRCLACVVGLPKPGGKTKNYLRDVTQQILEVSDLDCRELGLNERMQFAIQVQHIEDIWLFWRFLGKVNLDLACVEVDVLRSEETTILIYCAKLIARRERIHQYEWRIGHTYDACRYPLNEDYVKLVRQSFKLKDLQRSFDRGQSPLLSIFVVIAQHFWVNMRTVESYAEAVKSALHFWLLNLHEVGVDLGSYGEQEFEFFRKQTIREITIYTRPSRAAIRLISFRWGQTAKDWKFWWSSSRDEIGDTFLLDHIPRTSYASTAFEVSCRIPGAWIEDEKYTDWRTEKYLEKLAMSRRRRKRYLTAAGLDTSDAREVFGCVAFHGTKYQPKVPHNDCLAHCDPWSGCRIGTLVMLQHRERLSVASRGLFRRSPTLKSEDLHPRSSFAARARA